jgi:large subunit ribosomal protein L31
MKPNIHPEYSLVDVRLADGTTVKMRSTMKSETYVSDVDATNHPFYTGKRQYVDTAGRVEKFNRRYGKRKAQKTEEAESAEKAEATEA